MVLKPTTNKYILKGKRVYPVYNLFKWGAWFEEHTQDRIIKQETLPNGEFLSTVFLGLDYAFSPNDKRQLFETMLFKTKINEVGFHDEIEVARCSTYGEALRQHEKIKVNYLKKTTAKS